MSSLFILQCAQCAVRNIFTIVVPRIPARKRSVLDSVIASYLPKQAAPTVGMSVMHFFSLDEADKFTANFTRMRVEN
jgi:hypothetical protein